MKQFQFFFIKEIDRKKQIKARQPPYMKIGKRCLEHKNKVINFELRNILRFPKSKATIESWSDSCDSGAIS